MLHIICIGWNMYLHCRLLPKGYGWYVKATTERGMLDVPVLLKDQRKLELKERSVTVLTAERIVEVETKKNENITTLTDDQSS